VPASVGPGALLTAEGHGRRVAETALPVAPSGMGVWKRARFPQKTVPSPRASSRFLRDPSILDAGTEASDLEACGPGWVSGRLSMRAISRAVGAAAILAIAAAADMTMEAALAWALPGARTVVVERHGIAQDDASRLSAEAEVRIDAGEVVLHRGSDGTNATGYAMILDERGRDDPITFAVALTPAGAIRDLEVVTYRARHGGGIRDREFLDQFRGRDDPMRLEVGAGIDAVSGATISSRAAARAARRALAVFRHLHPPPGP
jgi:Na+-translocating ferredoxin:NAD+ oxidoreductase RnfG subunit